MESVFKNKFNIRRDDCTLNLPFNLHHREGGKNPVKCLLELAMYAWAKYNVRLDKSILLQFYDNCYLLFCAQSLVSECYHIASRMITTTCRPWTFLCFLYPETDSAHASQEINCQ